DDLPKDVRVLVLDFGSEIQSADLDLTQFYQLEQVRIKQMNAKAGTINIKAPHHLIIESLNNGDTFEASDGNGGGADITLLAGSALPMAFANDSTGGDLWVNRYTEVRGKAAGKDGAILKMDAADGHTVYVNDTLDATSGPNGAGGTILIGTEKINRVE